MSQQVNVTRKLQVGLQSVANRAAISEITVFTVNTTPGSILNTVAKTVTFAATGVALGDFIIPSAPYDLIDIAVTAYVQADNAIELVFTNYTTNANITLAAGDWKMIAIKAT